ncbi:hypothetical protein Pcinc_010396 [Petrolisthes cinctipes]|uniref:Uncharacterized protein n=1 Tax=Petrolisthes cinctipes TaxID=88211 RepID=A0AAE1KVE1_PETCI|nr:hypothetical protein Pcinc_010396 [Petrolisthes cinctipes]
MNTNLLGTIQHYEKYNAWRVGDTRLDWSGAQPGQDVYQGIPAEGTPLVWTTNNVLSPGYQELNTVLFGLLMHVRSPSQATCSGTGAAIPPYTSNNHMGRCGYINVFTFDFPTCIINVFP